MIGERHAVEDLTEAWHTGLRELAGHSWSRPWDPWGRWAYSSGEDGPGVFLAETAAEACERRSALQEIRPGCHRRRRSRWRS